MKKETSKSILEEYRIIECILYHTCLTLLKTYHVNPIGAYGIYNRVYKLLKQGKYIKKIKK